MLFVQGLVNVQGVPVLKGTLCGCRYFVALAERSSCSYVSALYRCVERCQRWPTHVICKARWLCTCQNENFARALHSCACFTRWLHCVSFLNLQLTFVFKQWTICTLQLIRCIYVLLISLITEFYFVIAFIMRVQFTTNETWEDKCTTFRSFFLCHSKAHIGRW